jgi:diacylglycerol kinase family enzyme
MEIKTDRLIYENDLVMATICNGKWEGGSFLVAPNADMKDGMLDVLSIKKIPLPLLISYLLRFRWGPAKWMSGIETFTSKRIEISTSVPVAVHRDGEHLGTGIRHLKCTVAKNALKVLIPTNY